MSWCVGRLSSAAPWSGHLQLTLRLPSAVQAFLRVEFCRYFFTVTVLQCLAALGLSSPVCLGSCDWHVSPGFSFVKYRPQGGQCFSTLLSFGKCCWVETYLWTHSESAWGDRADANRGGSTPRNPSGGLISRRAGPRGSWARDSVPMQLTDQMTQMAVSGCNTA